MIKGKAFSKAFHSRQRNAEELPHYSNLFLEQTRLGIPGFGSRVTSWSGA
ncbi:hypothetical protein NXW97_24325 [Bacteroides faecis]|uniref:Uncharacterized protein n=1 Tax=Bacteroides faecis TaxID=674529 RepID=A0AAW5P3Q4_9BACE|nr:hypothetical protein [Bacteroides faecis]MCS2795078.1 hypothetical protein [Bacteroides faecis]